MKTRNALLLAFAMTAVSACAETYWLDTSVSYNSKPLYLNALTNAYNWLAADGVTHAGAAGTPLSSSDIYYLRGNKASPGNEGKVRLAAGTSSYTFGELHIGDLSASRGGQILDYNKSTITFNGIVYFEKGSFVCNQGHGGIYTMAGDFRVNSPNSAPFFMAVGYTGSTLLLNGSLSCDAGCTFNIGGNNGYSGADPDSSIYRFNADLSGYCGNLNLNNDDTTPRTDTVIPQTFQFERSSAFPGSVTVSHDTKLVLTAGTALEMKDLSLGANVLLQFTATDAASPSLVATNSFSHDGKVYMVLNVTHGQSVGTVTHTLLTVPIANAFCMDDFECTVTPANNYTPIEETLSVETNETAGTCSLVYSYCYAPEGSVYLVTGDSSSKENDGANDHNSSLTNATHWSDGCVPESGKDYVVRSVNGAARYLRTLQRGWSDGEGNTAENYTFPGDSLTLAKSGALSLCADKITFRKLRLYDGSLLMGVHTQPATMIVNGDIEVVKGVIRLRRYVGRRLRLTGTLSGSGELRLEGFTNTGSPLGYYSFNGLDTSAFKGRIRVSNHSDNSKPDFINTNQTFEVTAESQLGGTLDAFDPAALILDRYGTLQADASFAITTNNNRGMTVSGAGRIRVPNAGHTLNLLTPLAVTGSLRKNGPGPLRLGSALTVGEATGVENILELTEGKLRLAHAEALNGMTLAVSNGPSLVMELDPSDPARAAYGFRMEKSAVPFALAEGVDGLPLTFEAAGAAPADGNPFTHGILTVTNDADVVASVRSMLPSMSGRVFRGYSQELVETEDAEAGTYTFALRFKKRGLVFSVR